MQPFVLAPVRKSGSHRRKSVAAFSIVPGDRHLLVPGFCPGTRWIAGSIAAGLLIGWNAVDERTGWAGVVGFAMFLLSQWHARSFRAAVFSGWLTGCIAFSIGCRWLPSTIDYLGDFGTSISLVIAILLQMFTGSVYAWFAGIWWVSRKFSPSGWVVAPAIVLALEWVYPAIFPSPFALMLTGHPSLIQLAEIGGVHLVSLYFLALSASAAWTISIVSTWLTGSTFNRRAMFGCSLGWVVLIAIAGWGQWRIEQLENGISVATGVGKPLRLGLVQADTQFHHTHRRMIDVSRQMAGHVDLIVWPEASLGDYSSELTDFSDPVTVYNNSTGDHTRYQPFPDPVAPLLAGADVWNPIRSDGESGIRYVSALLFDVRQRLIGRHDKNTLMPFGEYIPAESMFPWLRRLTGSDRKIAASVTNEVIATINGCRIGALLCCEDMDPTCVGQQVADGANVLISIGNGMVFDSPIALQQHFRIARFRAIEHRLPLVRCTSKGVSAVVLPSGRVESQLPEMQDAAGIVSIRPMPARLTIFGRTGNLIPAAVAILFPTVVLLTNRTHLAKRTM